jgi:hypothetical protein
MRNEKLASHFAGIENAISEVLTDARFSIKVAVAWFTNDNLFNILCDKANQGVDVQVILSNSINDYDKGEVYSQQLQNVGGALFRCGAADFKSGGLMHHKFAVVDDETVITGSFNWTNQGNRNEENIVIIRDGKQAQIFLHRFDRLKLSANLVDGELGFHKAVSFTASKAVVAAGEEVQLHWVAEGADSVRLKLGRTVVELPETGVLEVSVQDESFYNLRALYGDEEINRQILVRVARKPTLSYALEYNDPAKGHFTGLMPTLPMRDVYTVPEGIRVRLSWKINHASLFLINGKEYDATEGSVMLPTEQSKGITLRAVGIKEEEEKSFTLRVLQVPRLDKLTSVLPGNIELQMLCSYEKTPTPSSLRLKTPPPEIRTVKIDDLKGKVVPGRLARFPQSGQKASKHLKKATEKNKSALSKHLKQAFGKMPKHSKLLSKLLKQYE